ADLLERRNYKTSIRAKNGQHLIDLLAASNSLPDVCIVDIRMPVLNGVETTQRVMKRWPSISVIGYSIDDNSESQKDMFEAGAVAYLLKNSSINKIVETIEDA